MLDKILTVLMGLFLFGSFAGLCFLVSYLCARFSMKKQSDPFCVGDKVRISHPGKSSSFSVVESVTRTHGGNDIVKVSGLASDLFALTENGYGERVRHVTFGESVNEFED